MRRHVPDVIRPVAAVPRTPASGAAWIVPKTYVQTVGDEGFKQHPIGLGPYKFVSHTPGV